MEKENSVEMVVDVSNEAEQSSYESDGTNKNNEEFRINPMTFLWFFG